MDAYETNKFSEKVNQLIRGTSGTGATATAVLETTGSIKTIVINDGGSGYSVDDVLTVAVGTGGTATVLTVDESGVITGIELTTAGSGYDNATGAATTVAPSGGTGATVDIVVEFAIDSITVDTGGSAYLFATVKIDTTYGTGGEATATLNSGAIASIAVDSGGFYTDVPDITITGEPTNSTELFNALVTYDTSLQNARILEALIDSTFVNVGTPNGTLLIQEITLV
jgi:hypothetical protein